MFGDVGLQLFSSFRNIVDNEAGTPVSVGEKTHEKRIDICSTTKAEDRSIGGVFGGVGGLISNIKPINTIDVCKCLDLSYKKDSGLSYDESYWNKCVDKYYSKDEMVQKCMFKD